jgi:hypothetical protein
MSRSLGGVIAKAEATTLAAQARYHANLCRGRAIGCSCCVRERSALRPSSDPLRAADDAPTYIDRAEQL